MRFPIRPSTRSPLGSQQPEPDMSWLGEDGQDRPLFSCPAKKKLNARRSEAFNAYENHEVGFRHGFAPSAAMALVGGLPDATAGNLRFVREYLGRPGEPRRQALWGRPDTRWFR